MIGHGDGTPNTGFGASTNTTAATKMQMSDSNNNGIAMTTTNTTNNSSTMAKKQPRKRKCPNKDTILISVPLHVTADLGIALRRTRKKREARIKRWLAQETGGTEQLAVKKKATKKNKDDKESESDGEGDRDLDSDDDGPDAIRKEQYGSVLDYLEAKYVRGVSIAEYNSEGERVKVKKAKRQSTDDNGSDDEGEEHFDSDQDDNRSVYGDDGFIDDSLLQEEVVNQVFASDSYGKTKIEMEAKRRRKEKLLDGSKEENEDDELSAAGSDFDDGFFVNIGDLEMEEGWKGDEDVVISPVKRKPGRPKKSEQGEVAKQKVKKRKVDKEAASPKKKKNKVVGKDSNGSQEKATKTTKKKDDGKVKVMKKKKTTSPAENGKKKQSKESPATPKKSPSAKPKEEPKTPKGIMDNLAKQVKRKYNICVKMIGELTPKHLPRKTKPKATAKITVSIPADKSVGDTIMFENPHVPNQRLKVQIPAKANMESRTFFATVPLPKSDNVSEPKENNIPKELKEALYNYANTYDEWVNAKSVHNLTIPEAEREDLKPNSEKLKKFDTLVTEFPTNLASPIDIAALRIIVRRMRTNKNKAQSRASASSASPSKSKPAAVKPILVEEKKVMASVKLDAPQRGTTFASVVFDGSNFI
ncbi:hypothetical protein ACHAXN_010319 [Cyclotella atomus]